MGLPLDLHTPTPDLPDTTDTTGKIENQDTAARQYLAQEYFGSQNFAKQPAVLQEVPSQRLLIADAGPQAPQSTQADKPSDKPGKDAAPAKTWEQKYEEVEALIKDNYYPKEHLAASNFYDLDKKFRGHINGVTDYVEAIKAETKALNDPWTEFTSSKEIQENRQRVQDGYRATGIWIKNKGNDTVIEALLYGFPAYKSDMRIGDKILAINGKSITGLPLADIEPMLQGKKGDTINIQFETPEGDKRNQDLPVVDPKPMESSAAIINDPKTGKKVLQLGMLAFDRESCDKLEDSIKAISADQLKGVSGIVLDLRGNEGGMLPPILRTADMFVPKGDFFRLDDNDGPHMVQTKGFDEADYTLDAPTRAMLRTLPMAILVNGTTRSAPETLTAGLREQGRPVAVVGDQSYGKAIAYDTSEVPEGFLKYTIEELKTPKGFAWQGKGLKPDIEVHNARGANADDVQLTAAIDAVIANKH